jgi:hypothetical protein
LRRRTTVRISRVFETKGTLEMIKNSILALVATAAIAGAAMPAMAAGFDDDYVLYQLQSKGIAAQSVEEWGSKVRAFVSIDDGRTVMQLFDADTLAPVNR